MKKNSQLFYYYLSMIQLERICFFYERFLLIKFNSKQTEMKKTPGEKNKKGHRRQPPATYHKILQQIKYIQKYVSQIDRQTHHNRTLQLKIKAKPSVRRQVNSSNENIRRPQSVKQSKKQSTSQNKCQTMETIRRGSKSVCNNSAVMKFYHDTSHQDSLNRLIQSQKKENEEIYFPISYISLQVQNLKLQKQNLNLQKQLLEQQLMMERREKRLLKDKIKRIKTHNLAQRLSSQSKKQESSQQHQSDVSQFRASPIKIKIPEITLNEKLKEISCNKITMQNLHENTIRSNKNSKGYKNNSIKTFQSNTSFKNMSYSSDAQQLLISGVRLQESDKQNEKVLQTQFWTLLSQCQNQKSQKKWELREALGDIANKLKVLRKN